MSLEGSQLGHYRLTRQIGSGGMGEIYLAEDIRIARLIAVKVVRNEPALYPNHSTSQESSRLFQREMKAVASLDNPHILTLHDFGEEILNHISITYMVMPYRPEGSLGDWLDQRTEKLSFEEINYIFQQAADALQHAHDNNIIHQDVKPSNFLIRNRRDKPNQPDLLLADFGIAKILGATSTASQTTRGTAAFMPPEQWDGQAVAATDQYALAIMAYLLLTGRTPFQGRMEQVMRQHFMTEPATPSTLNPEINVDTDRVILHALAKKPEERFSSVSNFANALQQALLHTEKPTIHTASDPYTSGSETLTPTISVPPASLTPALEVLSPTILAASIPTFQGKDTLPPLQPFSSVPPKSRVRTFVVAGLALLIVLSSIIGIATYYNNTYQSNTHATTSTSYAASQDRNDINATATVQANITSATHTTTVAAKSTEYAQATAQAGSRNPYPPNTGTLALDDPLSSNDRGYNWETGERDQGYCTFAEGSYRPNISLSGYFHSCLAQSNKFSNFVFEVQMTLLTGNAGGIVFRANRATTHFYYFTVDSKGNYLLKSYYDKNGDAWNEPLGRLHSQSQHRIP